MNTLAGKTLGIVFNLKVLKFRMIELVLDYYGMFLTKVILTFYQDINGSNATFSEHPVYSSFSNNLKIMIVIIFNWI